MTPLCHCDCGEKFSVETRGVCWGCAAKAVDAAVAAQTARFAVPDGYTLVLKADLARLAKLNEASKHEA